MKLKLKIKRKTVPIVREPEWHFFIVIDGPVPSGPLKITRQNYFVFESLRKLKGYATVVYCRYMANYYFFYKLKTGENNHG